jgi:hypothetical protein
MSDRTASSPGLSPAATRQRPLYARVLRLRHLNPSGLLCFVFFEAMVALGVLLALAELTNWWSVVVLPVSVAAMVKINDAVAAAVARSANRAPEQTRVDRAQAGPASAGLVRSPTPPAQAQSPSLHRRPFIDSAPMAGPRAAQPAASQTGAASQVGPQGVWRAGPQAAWQAGPEAEPPAAWQGGPPAAQQAGSQAGPHATWEAAAQASPPVTSQAGAHVAREQVARERVAREEAGPQRAWEAAAQPAWQGGPQVAREVELQGTWEAAARAEPPAAWQSGPPEAGRAAWRPGPPPAQHAAPHNAGQADPWAGQQRRPTGAIRRAASASELNPGLHPEAPIPVVPGPPASNPAVPHWNEPDTADLSTVGVDTAEIDPADLDTTDLAHLPVNRSPLEIAERRVGRPQAEDGEIADTPESRARQSASRRYG